MKDMIDKKSLKELLEKRFLDDECKRLCDLPLPSSLKDAYKGAKRIKKSLDLGEKIAVVGDYDVDGVVSSVLMMEFFAACKSEAILYLPNRFKDGYGVNENIVEKLAAKGVKLIITVDNGILAFKAALKAKSLNIDLIISDHHNPSEELPNAYAIINPKQAQCGFSSVEICGAQVAWYLLAALKDLLKIDFDLSKFLELLCLAIVADMMELRDLNRLLVKKGKKALNKSKRPAFLVLKEYFDKESFSYEDLGFLIAPLINAAGRMDDAYFAYAFLRAKDKKEANLFLNKLIGFNLARKSTEEKLFQEAKSLVDERDKALVLAKEGWHEGVLGIVASRLIKHFNKPAFVLCIKNQYAKGSARSVGDLDLLALLQSCKPLLYAYGGHKGAAGLCIKESLLVKLKKALNKELKDFKVARQNYKILGELKSCEIDFELLDILEEFEPYGQKNPRPIFKFSSYLVDSFTKIGKDKAHAKIILNKKGRFFSAIFFNYDKILEKNMKISFIASISRNIFKGRQNLQILVRELL